MARHYERGIALCELEQYEQAIPEFTLELAEEPNSSEALCCRAMCLVTCRHFTEAKLDIREAIKLDPESALPYFVLSKIEANLDNFQASEAAVLEALRLDPSPEFYRHYASLLYHTGRVQQALNASRRALELDPQDEDSLLEHGQYLAAIGRPDEAEALFGQALAISPNMPDIHYALGRLKMRDRASELPLKLFREARRLAPADFNHAGNMAFSHGQTLAPLRWIKPIIPWWTGWTATKRWAVLVGLCTLAVFVAWTTQAFSWRIMWPAVVATIILANYCALQLTYMGVAMTVGKIIARRDLDLSYVAILRAIAINSIVLPFYHIVISAVSLISAVVPPIPFLILGVGSFWKVFRDLLEVRSVVWGLIHLLFALLLLMLVVGGAIASTTDLRLGIYFWVALLIFSFFSDYILAWLNRPRGAKKFSG